ncbi:Ca-activated chloride channel family protein [Nocardioides albertanoniae]|uniref:Ca-activated chloride channel family protein n=1 Tax=Nocardioides albertanoniae TaxID=1175486 RepID=A0A543A3A8_9ACTN|nr:VWA domain-containing protein [Nocardioides albertanoniae]TQL67067.1 Ca-activated chloride channel family protein [Nocardioides albertanoniae]
MSAKTWQILTIARRVLIVLLTVVVLARPTWGAAPSQMRTADLDVLVVVDRTRSMVAEDGPGDVSRMALLKKDLKALSAELPSVRFGAITFGGEVVRTEMPFTYDTTAFDAWVDGLYAERAFDGSGSSVDAPREEVVDALERDRERYPERRRIVVFASDGENTRGGGDQESFSEVNDLSAGGVVLGYGTEQGGRMPWDDERPQDGYLKDGEGQEARSKIDLANLREIASQMGLESLHRTTTDPAEIATEASTWDSKLLTEESATGAKVSRVWIFGFPLIALLLWELWGHRRRGHEAEEVLS